MAQRQTSPAPRPKRRFWRTCRIYFRRVRITVWLVLLALTGGLVYLDQVGLPDFAKRPLLEKLRARGVDLQFSRLRLSWWRGLVAENVRFGQSGGEPGTPQMTLAEVRVQLNPRALARFQIQVDSLLLLKGRLVWPVPDAREPRELAIENIQSYLRFLPGDEWALDDFRANFAGARILLLGSVSHASAVREWGARRAEKSAPARVWRDQLRQIADTLERIRFSSPPDLKIDVHGDARDFQSFSARLMLSAPGADTPWGTVTEGRFSARLFPATNSALAHATLSLEAESAQTPWASTTNFQLNARLALIEGQTNLANADLDLKAAEAHTRWGSGKQLKLTLHLEPLAGQSNLINGQLELVGEQLRNQFASAAKPRLTAQWIHSLTNPVPLSGQAQLHCDHAETKWGAGAELQFVARLSPRPQGAARADESWAWWAGLEPYPLNWELRLNRLASPELLAEEVACGGSWNAPRLAVTNLQAKIYEGRLGARADLSIASRELRFDLVSDFDPHRIYPVLPESARRWLDQFTWKQTPKVKGEMSLILPAWTNRAPDWRAEVQPTIRLDGEFDIQGGGSFRKVPVTTAQSQFIYSNMVWLLPHLIVTRPEGRLEAQHRADDRTKDFYWRVKSTLDPMALRPVFGSGPQRGLDLFTFAGPPFVDAEVWGRSRDPGRTWLKGRVAATNFTFRGESISSLQTTLDYSNRVVRFTAPDVLLGVQQLRADGLTADFSSDRVYLTNGFSTADPMVVARAIGAQVARTMAPYRFHKPPTVRAHGIIPMHREEDADLHFEVRGGPFNWTKFTVPHISGDLHWRGLGLTMTGMYMDFYGGNAGGSATFRFPRGQNTEFQFSLSTTNTQLQFLMADLQPGSKLEGTLSGNLAVTRGIAENWQKSDGYGDFRLNDGLIWDIPVFGVFTPVLNGIVPGLGSSRANAGSFTFVMTNGVLVSDDLEIQSTGMRLQYRGTVDTDGNVNARVEAGLLRDVWFVGPLFSTILWPVTKMFEYKVTGTLGEPKMEPVYIIPKIVLFPFHPLRTLKDLLPTSPNQSRTNGPPALHNR